MSFKLSFFFLAVATVHSAAGASDPATAPEPVILKGPLGVVVAIAFSPNGKMAAAVGSDRLCVWTVATQELRFAVRGHGGRTGAVAFSPDGKMVAVGAWDMKVWAADSGKEVAFLGRQDKG
jgi:WD40 repeat protein